MAEYVSHVKRLNSDELGEYRALQTQIGAVLSEEIILSRCAEWTASKSVVEAVAAHRNERVVRCGRVLPTSEIVATNDTLSMLVRRGYLEEMFSVQSNHEMRGTTRFVRVSSLGRDRLPVVRTEIETLAKSFFVLDERHASAPHPSLQWWQMLANVFGR
jgi:hypothetical protein